MTVPKFAESGTWIVESALLVDQVGNLRWMTATDLTNAGLPNSFTQTGSSDSEPPVLQSLSLSPSSINTAGSSQVITVTARITDNLAGNAGEGYSSSPSQIRFKSPSGNQSVTAMLSGTERVSGTALDGIHSYAMTVPKFAESGTWIVESALLVDQVGNLRWMTATDLTNAGLPNSFTNN
jgi:serine protease